MAEDIQLLGDFTGIPADFIMPLLLIINLLDHGKGKDDGVFLKGKQGLRIVE